MIALGSDQAGYELKQVVMKHLEERGLAYKDYGSYNSDPALFAVDCRGSNLYVHENAVVIDKTGGGLWNMGDNTPWR